MFHYLAINILWSIGKNTIIILAVYTKEQGQLWDSFQDSMIQFYYLVYLLFQLNYKYAPTSAVVCYAVDRNELRSRVIQWLQTEVIPDGWFVKGSNFSDILLKYFKVDFFFLVAGNTVDTNHFYMWYPQIISACV